MSKELIVGFMIFDNVEELDFIGPYEVFGAVNCITPANPEEPPVSLFTVAPEKRTIRCAHGLHVVPDYGFEDCPPADITIIPGGSGARALVDDEAVLNWLRGRRDEGQLLMSVCTGAFLLAATGLLDGKACTTHWSCAQRLRELFPQVRILEDELYVDNGKVVTAAGVSAGIDAALHLVKRYFGEDKSRATARYIQYETSPAYLHA